MRQVGDMAMLLQNYELAQQTHLTLKREIQGKEMWLHYAGALVNLPPSSLSSLLLSFPPPPHSLLPLSPSLLLLLLLPPSLPPFSFTLLPPFFVIYSLSTLFSIPPCAIHVHV